MPESTLTISQVIGMLLNVIGGLGLFLLGIKNMSEGMQAVAGDRLRKLISAVTSNRFIACGVGTLITSIIQSSSVTTVMVVGFVNGGFMTLTQAIGVIIGANIGTTVTGWILTLKIAKYGLPILGVSALVYLFSKRDRFRYTAMAICGIGMVFFGLETMSAGFKIPEVNAVLKNIFAQHSATSYLSILYCAFVGCLATMIVQSSSATLGVTVALARTGVIDFPTAAALILGLNIGTTITAFLASLGATTSAKRAAYAHIIFNVVGTLWIFPLFPIYVHGVDSAVQVMSSCAGNIAAKIALTHTGFNVINTIIFLPLIGVLTMIVTRLVPDKPHKEIPRLTYLDVRMLASPAFGIEQSYDEILKMRDGVTKMAGWLRVGTETDERDSERERKFFHREEILDVMQKEIVEFLGSLLSGSLPHDVTQEVRKQLRIADEYESISDYMVAILKLKLKIMNSGLEMSTDGRCEVLDLHDHVARYLDMINEAVQSRNEHILTKAKTEGDAITNLMKNYRETHMRRVETEGVSPLKSLIYMDMLQSYRKIKDHALNIAEALAGEK